MNQIQYTHTDPALMHIEMDIYRELYDNTTEIYVCDEDIYPPVLSRNTSNLGAYLGASIIDGLLVPVYEKDIEDYKKALRPYYDAVAKMLIEDSEQGNRVLRFLLKEICSIDASLIHHMQGDIYFGNGNHPRHKMDCLVKLDESLIVNLEMQQYLHSKEIMKYRIVRQHATLIASHFREKPDHMISIWFCVKGTLHKDNEILHKGEFLVYPKDTANLIDKLPFGNIYVIELEKLCHLKTPGETSFLRFCQFLLHYGDPEKKELIDQLKEDELIMESAKRVDEFCYDLREICQYVREHYDELERREEIQRSTNEAMQQGLEQGIEQGLEKGLVQGAKAARKEIIKQMYKKGLDLFLISELTKMDVEKIEEILHDSQ